MASTKDRLNSVALQLNARKNSRYCPHCGEVVAISTYNKHKKRFIDQSGQWIQDSKRRKVNQQSELLHCADMKQKSHPQVESQLTRELQHELQPNSQPEPEVSHIDCTCDARHKKTDLKVFVVPIFLLVWHRLVSLPKCYPRRFWLCWHDRLYSQKVCVIPKEGWTRPSLFWYDNNKDLKVCFLVMQVM